MTGRRCRDARRIARKLGAALCALALAVGSFGVSAQVRLPALGDSASDDLSVGTERRYGEQIMAEIRRDPAYLDDPILLEYVQSIWTPLVAAARERGDIAPEIGDQFAWEVFLVRDRSINAFALPGGRVGIHLGLIASTSTRDELASVLAHELAHVTQRHIARSVGEAGRQGTIGMVGLILGMIAASRSQNPDIAQAAIAGTQAATLQGQLNFSRQMEREADRIGFGTLTQAGFDAGGMSAMFDRLDQASRLNDGGAFPYLRSHPLTVERLAEARDRLTHSARSTGRALVNGHSLLRSRARVLMDTSAAALRRHLEVLHSGKANGVSAIETAYAAVLGATLLHEFGEADRALRELDLAIEARGAGDSGLPRDAAMLRAEALVARGAGDLALEAMASAGTDSRAAMLLRAQAARLAGEGQSGGMPRLRSALEALQTWLAGHPRDALAWREMSEASARLGMPLRALRARAEAAAADGDVSGAIERLRAAQRASRVAGGAEWTEAAIVDMRLKQLEGEYRVGGDSRGDGRRRAVGER
jgi:predicted Zn-dependent protease